MSANGDVARRIGLLIPSSNTTIEQEFARFGPAGLSFHFARLPMTEVTAAGFASQDAAIDAACALLADAKPDAVVLCQSAASFMGGADYDTRLRERMQAAAGVPGLPAGAVMAEALAALRIRRVALAVPFAGAASEATARYLDAKGIGVATVTSLQMIDNFAIAAVGEETIIDLAVRAAVPEADAVMLPGGNMRCLPLVARLEAATGRPIITTNQAVIWALARLFDVALPPDTFGALGALDRPAG